MLLNHEKENFLHLPTPIEYLPVSYTHLDVYKRQYSYHTRDAITNVFSATSGG